MEKTRRRSIAISMLVLTCILSGCTAEPKDHDELKGYAKETFGAYTVLEEVKKDDVSTLRLMDDEYGFEYWVTSSVGNVYIDGTPFWETESTTSNFHEQYYQYILEQEEDEILKAKSSTKWEFGYQLFPKDENVAYLYLYDENDLEEAKNQAKIIGDIFAKYDNRKYFDNHYVEIATPEGVDGDKIIYSELIAAYNVHENTWTYRQTEEEKAQAEIDFITEYVHDYLTEKAEYDHSERMTLADTGLTMDDIMHTFDEPTSLDSTVTLYYYNVGKEQYFVADFFVNPKYVNGYTYVRHNNFPEKYWFWD